MRRLVHKLRFTFFNCIAAVAAGGTLCLSSLAWAQSAGKVNAGYVAGSWVNVRAQANDSALITAQLPINTPVLVSAQQGAWCQLQSKATPWVPAAQGYVACTLLRPTAVMPQDIKAELQRSQAWDEVDFFNWIPSDIPPAQIPARLQALERYFFMRPNFRAFEQYGKLLELQWLIQHPAKNTEDPSQAMHAGRVLPARPLTLPKHPVIEVMKSYLTAGVPGDASGDGGRAVPDEDKLFYKGSYFDGSTAALYPELQDLRKNYGLVLPPAERSLFKTADQIVAMIGEPFAKRVRQKGAVSIDWVGETTPNLLPFIERLPQAKMQYVFGPREVQQDSDAGVQGVWDVRQLSIKTTGIPLLAIGAERVVEGQLTGFPSFSQYCIDSDPFGVRLTAPLQNPLVFVATQRPLIKDRVTVRTLLKPDLQKQGDGSWGAYSIDLDGDQLPDLLLFYTQKADKSTDMAVNFGPGPLRTGFSLGAVLMANINGRWKTIHAVSQYFCT